MVQLGCDPTRALIRSGLYGNRNGECSKQKKIAVLKRHEIVMPALVLTIAQTPHPHTQSRAAPNPYFASIAELYRTYLLDIAVAGDM
ncbi:MAG: hypothetical protein C5S38_09125 [Candidatus Methanophagaceae archaeon]|nr:MAG: hypothetical protein C5S38_09125 [Methanophagales archaeon]